MYAATVPFPSIVSGGHPWRSQPGPPVIEQPGKRVTLSLIRQGPERGRERDGEREGWRERERERW